MLTAASNKKITNRAPSDYLKDVEQELGADLQKSLDANFVSTAAFEAAKRDDYPGFLGERSKTLTGAISALTGW